MKQAGPAALALIALPRACLDWAVAGDVASIPAELYSPFQREKAADGEAALVAPKAVAAFPLGAEPGDQRRVPCLRRRPSSMAQVAGQEPVRRRPAPQALAVGSGAA